MGVGGKARPLGYVVICVEVEGVPEYDEDQVAFVVDDNTTFSLVGESQLYLVHPPLIAWSRL